MAITSNIERASRFDTEEDAMGCVDYIIDCAIDGDDLAGRPVQVCGHWFVQVIDREDSNVLGFITGWTP